jgi:hypothetical protein
LAVAEASLSKGPWHLRHSSVELAVSVDAVVAGNDQFNISRVRIDAQVKITLNRPFMVLPILPLLNKKREPASIQALAFSHHV